MEKIGSPEWNDAMYQKHPTPHKGIAGWVERRRGAVICKHIKKNLLKTKNTLTIVELGCEAGHLLKQIRTRFPESVLYGYDISLSSLQEAKKLFENNENVHFGQLDITQPFTLPEMKVDFIICSETLEHIPAYQEAMNNICLATPPGTVMIFTVPIESFKNTVKKWLTRLKLFDLFFSGIEKNLSEWHVNDFSKKEFNSMIGKHFRIIKYEQILLLHQLIVARKS